MARTTTPTTTPTTTMNTTMPDPANPPARWRYGDAWERYPIRAGERWRVGTGQVAVHDLFRPLPAFLKTADCLFIDPPWSQGNLTAFYTKAGRTDYPQDYVHFMDRLFTCIREIAPRICYLEVGNQAVTDFKMRLRDSGYGCVDAWPVTYYRKHPCWLLKGSHAPHTGRDYTGIDEEKCIEIITREEDYNVIGDLCMGRGLVGYYAFRAGRRFVGGELNPRRLAVLLERIARAGGVVERVAASASGRYRSGAHACAPAAQQEQDGES